jgi:hypothetical protein
MLDDDEMEQESTMTEEEVFASATSQNTTGLRIKTVEIIDPSCNHTLNFSCRWQSSCV